VFLKKYKIFSYQVKTISIGFKLTKHSPLIKSIF